MLHRVDEFDDKTQRSLPPFVEVEVVYQAAGPGVQSEQAWRAFEVWTKNRVYSCDWAMLCTRVVDRKTGKMDPKHSLLGARLSGGQLQGESGIEISYPCPRPGYEAVFQSKHGRGYTTTSEVTRVVLRLRVLTVSNNDLVPAWDDLTSGSGLHSKPDAI